MPLTVAVDARTVDHRFPGIGRYTANLLRALSEQLQSNERVVYLCSREQRAALSVSGARLQWVESNASPFSIGQQWRIPAMLKRMHADVYHSPYYLMPYWPGLRTVLTVYDLIPQRFPAYVSRQARLFFRLATYLALRAASHVIAISETTRSDFVKEFHIAPENISAIPLAAAPHFRPVSDEQVTNVREKHGLEQKYVLYVGSNKPHKNLAGLVHAWATLDTDLQTSHALVLAGRWDSRYKETKEEMMRLDERAKVHVLRDIADNDLPALYSGAELFVFPSYYEGFGLPVLEAMACGCAVACANVSSLPEVVEDAAILFDPRQPTNIAGAIAALLRNPEQRREYRERALRRAAAFSWQHTAAETLQIYLRVARA